MNHYFCKLLPPRTTFVQDMTEEEQKLMQKHVAYWMSFMEQGSVIVFGPVADPKGPWGGAVVRMSGPEEVESFAKNDPVMLANIGFKFEYYPMLSANYRK